MTFTTATILNLEHQLIDAIRTGNIDFLEKVMHEELLFLAPNGLVVTKEMDLASHRAGHMRVDELLPHSENINILGDTAVSVMVYTTRGTMMGNPISGRFRYIRTWKEFPEGIQIISGACIQL